MSEINSDSKKILNELVITRVFDAPRELVWKAWSEPEHFRKWWGPKDFACPVCKIDFQVGGQYLFCMRSKEEQEYWSTGNYKEIITNEKIVFSHSFADENGNIVPATYYGFEDFILEMEITVTFHDFDGIPGKTEMILKQVGMPISHLEGMDSGWNESFDKLGESLK